METLGQYLKKKREELGLSLNDVYQKTGITDSRLSRLEKDNYSEPAASMLKALANEYKVSAVELFIKAGYLDYDAIDISSQVFHGVEKLTDEDRKHIQGQIDYIISKRNKGELL